MKHLYKILILALSTIYISYSQGIDFSKPRDVENSGRFRTLQISGHSGGHLYSGKTLTNKLAGYGGLTAKFGWQSRDEEIWGPYGYPTYGLGWYAGFVGDPQIFGNPNALFGFIRFPISNPTRKNEFGIEPQFGLTYNLNPFNPETNPLNDAIGGKMAVYFAVNFGWTYKWTREMDITYGIDFTHFSNGRIYTPNYGLNMFGINLGLRYHYNADQHRVDDRTYPDQILQSRYQRSTKVPNSKVDINRSVNVYLALGTVQSPDDAGTKTRYGTFSGVIDYQHKFNNMHGATAGLDYMVDNSLAQDNPSDPDKYLIGLHAGYDFMFWKLTVGVHLGGYLTDNRGKTSYFTRPSLRYDINDIIYAQVGLKTNGFAADWVEWGIGFRPFRW